MDLGHVMYNTTVTELFNFNDSDMSEFIKLFSEEVIINLKKRKIDFWVNTLDPNVINIMKATLLSKLDKYKESN